MEIREVCRIRVWGWGGGQGGGDPNKMGSYSNVVPVCDTTECDNHAFLKTYIFATFTLVIGFLSWLQCVKAELGLAHSRKKNIENPCRQFWDIDQNSFNPVWPLLPWPWPTLNLTSRASTSDLLWWNLVQFGTVVLAQRHEKNSIKEHFLLHWPWRQYSAKVKIKGMCVKAWSRTIHYRKNFENPCRQFWDIDRNVF